MKITFYGAARTVTGSMHLVEANGKRILLDCGLYQGHRKEAFEKNRHMPVDPQGIDAVVLSHAHIDHSGNIPQLARCGFRGKVVSRPATRDLCEVMLRDSCFLQMRDLQYVNEKRRRQGKHLFEPLYTEEDVDAIMRRFECVPMKRQHDLGNGVSLVFHNAGHILGSAIVQLDVREPGGKSKRLVFSGDLGQAGQPILRRSECPQGADAIIVESTYADRLHPSADDVAGRLKSYIDDIVRMRGKLLIPAFSVGRTQQILYFLNRLHRAGRIPAVPVYIDSPLSMKATEIYRRHRECYNEDSCEILRGGEDPLSFPGLKFLETPEQSMSLNSARGPMVIIAASGMCEGGRVVHHLKECLCDMRNIVLFVGFQAEGTLGRRIVESEPGERLKLLGEERAISARVQTINALSAHADRNGLEEWIDGVKGDSVKKAFAVHGEDDRVEAMARIAREHGIPETYAPVPGQSFIA